MVEMTITLTSWLHKRSEIEHGLIVGIQHPGLPVGMLMSCPSPHDTLQVHVLDVNACWLHGVL